MPAMSVKVGTKYACNNNFVGDQICLQSRNFLKHLESGRLWSKNLFKKIEIVGIYGPQQIRLQAYIIYDIWSLSKLKLQA